MRFNFTVIQNNEPGKRWYDLTEEELRILSKKHVNTFTRFTSTERVEVKNDVRRG